MGMKDYARILRRSWLMIVVAALIGVIAAWTVTSTRTSQYAATSAAFVSSDRSGTLAELTQGNAFTEGRVSTYAKLASEPIVTQPVIDDFDLGVTPQQFADKLTVTIPVDTTMIEITVQDASPSVAANLANAVMTSLQTTVAEIETSTTPVTTPGAAPAQAAPPVKITQVRFAEKPTSPVSPNLLLNLAIGLFAGIALGALAGIIRDMVDVRIRTLDEFEGLTPIPVVGVVPQRSKGRPGVVDWTPNDPGDAFDESFRILRTNLQFLDVDGPATFIVTSPRSGDGKSTVLANLAVAIAANGSRVLVVDADLRRPQVHDQFGIEGGAGLTDILIGRAELADVVQPWRSERLHVLASGRVPPNPSELLGSAHMHEFMQQVQNTYEVVLYDCAPVLPVPDAAILSRHVGGVLLVTSIDRSRRDQVRGALRALERVHARISGIVVNRLTARGAMSYLAEPYQSHQERTIPAEPTDSQQAPAESTPG